MIDCPGHDCDRPCSPGSCECPPCACTRRGRIEHLLATAREQRHDLAAYITTGGALFAGRNDPTNGGPP